MSNKKLAIIVLGLQLSNPAYPAAMTISGPPIAASGGTFDLQIYGDFTGEGFIAGGTTFFWDSTRVQLDNIALNLNTVADFSCPGSVGCPPNTANSAPIVWGQFLDDLIAVDDPAPTLMATLSFTAVGPPGGPAAFSMQTNPSLTGGWFGAGFTPIDDPTFGTFSMEIGPSDTDGDSIADSQDNCLLEPNPQQRDTDGDSIGNLCDPDISPINDCIVNFDDLLQLELSFFVQGDFDTDFNGDGLTNMGDVGIVGQYFFGPPGPSGLPNACE